MASELKLVIVDDDEWKRSSMSERLDATAEVDVVDAVDQDTAAKWPRDQWKLVDAVLVDIFDDRAPGEVGTDLYSGISVVERVQRLPVKCIAVTPTCAHPLAQLRLQQAHPDYSYHRFQLNNLESLIEAVRFPGREHRLPDLPATTVKRLGSGKLRANDVVRTFVASALHGKLQRNSSLDQLKAVGVDRRAIDRYCEQIVTHGYNHFDTLTKVEQDDYTYAPPRWPIVRALTLKLLGRLDAPWSEFDKPWWREQI